MEIYELWVRFYPTGSGLDGGVCVYIPLWRQSLQRYALSLSSFVAASASGTMAEAGSDAFA